MATSWKSIALKRRLMLLGLIIGPCLVAGMYMPEVLPNRGGNILELGIITISCILSAWISLGFWTAIFGFFTMVKGSSRFTLSAGNDITDLIPSRARTAVLMPICNEDVTRVMSGMQVNYESLSNAGHLEQFDFFLLSDSSDPDIQVEEEIGWAALCERLNAFGKIFYRHRKVNLKRKSGNVADFCRRHGNQYTYMIVLDADSIMSGRTLTRMVRAMERNPECGLLQTLPQSVNRETLLARVQQFASQAYGQMFSAGLHYWLLGDSLYWGHNAIIRVAAFMQHCGLPRLSGKPPLGGDILSHDFVESALLCRHGWEVWLAYDFEGSYEETPPTLLDELKRDRRWCQGNLQHLRLAFSGSYRPIQRLMFFLGAMSYISAPLWLLLLLLGTTEAVVTALGNPDYFPTERCLFPTWPVSSGLWAMTLLASTAVLLFLPKILAFTLILFNRKRAAGFGGFVKLAMGILTEILISTLLAPARLLFHSRFVIITLMGRQAGWKSQQRSDRKISWGEALNVHLFDSILALAWSIGLFGINRSFFYWMSPFLCSLILAPALTVWTSSIDLGRSCKKIGLLLTPIENAPPWEIFRLQTVIGELSENDSNNQIGFCSGFIRAVADPRIFALHGGFLRGPRRFAPEIRKKYRDACLKGVNQGPASLTDREKKAILNDLESLSQLHVAIWGLNDQKRAREWGIPL